MLIYIKHYVTTKCPFWNSYKKLKAFNLGPCLGVAAAQVLHHKFEFALSCFSAPFDFLEMQNYDNSKLSIGVTAISGDVPYVSI